MKCRACGYVSLEAAEVCKRCGAALAAPPAGSSGAPAQSPLFEFPDLPPADRPARKERQPRRPAGRRGERAKSGAAAPPAPPSGSRAGAPDDPGDEELSAAVLTIGEAELVDAGSARAPSAPRVESPPDPDAHDREFEFEPWDRTPGAEVRPIIDNEDDIPDRYWAPESMGPGRRAVAVLVDQTLLTGLLGGFFLGAYAALALSGFETEYLFAAAGLRAALLPFALLAAVLSLAYHAYFHSQTGQTPGKALVGLEVRTVEGALPSWPRACLRWLATVVGLGCAGAGLLWALVEPRRRCWADIVTRTTVAARRSDDAGDADR